MARGGRPKKSDADKRTNRVTVRFNDEEFAVLEARAKAFGISKPELARRAITGVRMTAPVSAENMKQWRDLGRMGVNLNQVTRALHALTKRMEQLDDEELVGRMKIEPVARGEVVGAVDAIGAQTEEIYEMMAVVRALLIDQYEARVTDVEGGDRG